MLLPSIPPPLVRIASSGKSSLLSLIPIAPSPRSKLRMELLPLSGLITGCQTALSTYLMLLSSPMSLGQNVSVRCVLQSEFDLRLRPRLTSVASLQLDDLLSSLQGFRLQDGRDMRMLKLGSPTLLEMLTGHSMPPEALMIFMVNTFGRRACPTKSRSSPGYISRID